MITGVDVGTGLAMLSISGPIIVAMIKFMPTRENGNGSAKTDHLQIFCPEHHQLVNEVKEGFEQLHQKVNRTDQNVAFIRGFLEKERK